jgi:hypothetical protein
MSPARQVLLRLLQKGERARSRDAAETAELPLTPSSCPEYCELRTLEEIERFEAEIDLAARAGAIAVERERFGGNHARLRRLRLTSLERLGAHLDMPLRSAQVETATAALAHLRNTYPVLDTVLAAWARGRQVRGHGPDAAARLVDAAKAIDARRGDDARERLLRRESARIFGDSKRLEALTPWLDLLLTGELTPSGLEDAQIWSALGLRREPQPVLIAGDGVAILADASIALCRPYLGLPVDAVRSVETRARYVLTIENLTSFHDAARALADHDGLLIYTGGMPSPAWRGFFSRLLATLPAESALYHWGDIDEGGFRIAAQLATIANACGRRLLPWLMSPQDIAMPVETARAEPPSAASLKKMMSWAGQAGWPQVAEALAETPIRIEQEALDARLP